MVPRLWIPGGVRSPPNVPRDRSSALAPSRYPYAPCTGHLVNLPNLRRWQDLRTSHVKLDIFIHRNITGLNIAMKKITRCYHSHVDMTHPNEPRTLQPLQQTVIVHSGYPNFKTTHGNCIPIRRTYQSHLLCATP